MIKDTIGQKITAAMKVKDEVRLATLKLLFSAIHNAEIAKRPEKLTDEDEIAVVKKEAKKRKDAIEIYGKSGDRDRVKEKIEREEAELAVLQEYLPEEMGDEELEVIIQESINQLGAKGPGDTGRVMGAVMGKVKGQADGNRVSQIVREKLSQ